MSGPGRGSAGEARAASGPVRLGGALTLEELAAVARHGAAVADLGPEVVERMEASRAWVADTVRRGEETIYGVNTGFGSLATSRIRPDETRVLSRNVVLKCMVGVGPPLPRAWVRAMMLARAASLVKGVSGIRPEVVRTLIAMLNRDVTPHVPEKGSLGASGDLAPLAHIAAVATRGPWEGEEERARDSSGRAWHGDELLSGAEAMDRAGIERPRAEAKEGLALTNGTAQMVAAGGLGVHEAERLLAHAEVAAALSMEALLALTSPLDPRLHAANGQPGQVRVAARLRALLAGSRLVDTAPDRVQDAYSLRCTPQVLGPIADVLGFLRGRFEAALNAAADNPLIFPDPESPGGYRAVSGGNFHGQGPAMWLDMLAIAIAEAASIAERRVFRLLTPELSGGLPAMLVPTHGLDSGLMAIQYTMAALVSDNRVLAHPDSTDSIPTSANQEDHVSMGGNAARRALEVVDNVRTAVAVELIAAAQGVWLRDEGPERLGRGTAAAYRLLRERIPPLRHDRDLTPDIEATVGLVADGTLLQAVDDAVREEPA